MMKIKGLSMFAVPVLLLLNGCEVTGSEDVNEIDYAAFSEIEYSTTTNSFRVNGMVTNGGNANIHAPWYIEGQFYADSTFALKLGGDVLRMNDSLEPDVSMLWTLVLEHSNPTNYPNFAIKNLRAYTK